MGIIRGVAKGIEEDFYPLFLVIIKPFALREISTQVMSKFNFNFDETGNFD